MPASYTYAEFFSDVCNGIGAPPSQANLLALATVTNLEGISNLVDGNPKNFNPLNSVVPYGNSNSTNSVGVQNYQTYSDGVNGTIALLKGNAVWQPVVRALQQGTSSSAVLAAFQGAYASWNSHPDFSMPSGTRLNSILNGNIANATLGGTSTPLGTGPANYPAIPSDINGHVKSPLTKQQQVDMTNYLHALRFVLDPSVSSVNQGYGTGTPIPADLSGLTDAQAVALWNGVYDSLTQGKYPAYKKTNVSIPPNLPGQGILSGIASWETSLAKFLGNVISAKFWERVGIGLLGVIVLAFAVVILFKGEDAANQIGKVAT